jgi:flavin reductase (DIM6/NTAB) family NADH-FMN oxidoreductase RutF
VIDPDELDVDHVYKLLVGALVPRPIAWVSSADVEGVPNLAPFSFYTIVSCEPPMAAMVVGPHDYRDALPAKDTLVNVSTTGEFVINVVSVDLAESMAVTARRTPSDLDEFADAGVTPAPCRVVKVPRVLEAAISMECVLHEIVRPGSDDVVIGRIVRFHVREDLLTASGRIDVAALNPLGRLAGAYTSIGSVFELPVGEAT